MRSSECTMITSSLPAVLIGGPPNAGKSVLTYNLTKALRARKIEHYVFRAHPDGEGDWFFEMDEGVRQPIQHPWSDTFRSLVTRDVANRLLPLIVDIGGLPQEADTCIFQACTHSILLSKDGEEAAESIWRRYMSVNIPCPLADIRSQREGESLLLATEPVIKGTLTGLERDKRVHGPVFHALVERLSELFNYPPEELEQLHLNCAPLEFVLHLDRQLQFLTDDSTDTWTPDLLQPLLADVAPQTALAVYSRGPAWVYGALAVHAGSQPFQQFDPRLGWVKPPLLRSSASVPAEQGSVSLKESCPRDDTYLITLDLLHHYLDYADADQFELPEPPPERGVVVSGQLPLWLFTALARFYAQRNVPWIALHDARGERAYVIFSRVAERVPGTSVLFD